MPILLHVTLSNVTSVASGARQFHHLRASFGALFHRPRRLFLFENHFACGGRAKDVQMVPIRSDQGVCVSGVPLFRCLVFAKGAITSRLISEDTSAFQGPFVVREHQGDPIQGNVVVCRLVSLNDERANLSLSYGRVRRPNVRRATPTSTFSLFYYLSRFT